MRGFTGPGTRFWPLSGFSLAYPGSPSSWPTSPTSSRRRSRSGERTYNAGNLTCRRLQKNSMQYDRRRTRGYQEPKWQKLMGSYRQSIQYTDIHIYMFSDFKFDAALNIIGGNVIKATATKQQNNEHVLLPAAGCCKGHMIASFNPSLALISLPIYPTCPFHEDG